jgi:DNA-binding response OmpR family regulator
MSIKTALDISAAENRAHRVFIVEDEFLIRLTLSEVLSDEGYEVFEAETGDEALGMLDAAGQIDVLLTDIQLPGSLDGRALVRQARMTRPTLPVIFMTGRPDAAGNETVGALDVYVAKPYLPSEICAAVKRLLER